MIECSSCHTLNPDAERACLVCGAALARTAQTGVSAMGTARCPAGHPIDPSWKSCPYCGAGSATLPQQAPEPAADSRRTRLEPPAGPDRRTRLDGEAWPEPALAPPPSSTPRPTRLEEPGGPPQGRRTVLQGGFPEATQSYSPPPPPAAAPVVAPAPTGAPVRRLLGVLAAPDLGPGGSVFAVRGGRNTLGADRSNDVVLSGDTEVSGEHAVILHRNGTFHLADRLSTNGTWVNGEEVPANGTVPLADRDRIRCGRTELLFLLIEPAPGPSTAQD